ncbi:HNH endonuclease [Paraclostridium bifermentans]|uniref:HNH endonuclease n=1 Tax=Paraclostridium bifermentans TaxID=1490 RepID=UPI0018A8AF9B|nr:HNH endonuclease [Paraclostridium bifermentans]
MIFKFDELKNADLIPGAIYKGGSYKNPMKDDPLSKLFKLDGFTKGLGNQGGIRKASKELDGKVIRDRVAFVVLIDTKKQLEWPNYFNKESRQYTYYGDNRTAGNDIFKTKNLGNKLLYDIFTKSYKGVEERVNIPPIFIFESIGIGCDMKFIGLAVPGIRGKSMNQTLKRKWFKNDDGKFENYEAEFTILNISKESISRDWLKDLKAIGSGMSYYAPDEWNQFLLNGIDVNLVSEYQHEIEIKEEEFINYNNEVKRTVKVRVTQGPFRDKLISRDKNCVICGLDIKNLLVASHIKPWSVSNEYEKQDENNGLLLCANHDALFDKGYITFDGSGKLIISDEINTNDYKKLNLDIDKVINLKGSQQQYMKYHKNNIFKP